MQVLPAVVVFLAFSSITIWSWVQARQGVERAHLNTIEQSARSIESTIQARTSAYENILRASAGLFEASDFVSRAEWDNFVQGFDLQSRYPGFGPIAYVKVVTPAEAPALIDSIRADGYPEVRLNPGGARAQHAVVTYISPMEPSFKGRLGLDIYSDEPRRKAMETARDSGALALTGKLTFITDSINPPSGTIVFMPLYKKGSDLSTLEKRRADIVGYINAPFANKQLFDNIFSDQNQGLAFKVYHDSEKSQNLLYETGNYKKISTQPGARTNSKTITIKNQQWVIAGVASAATVSASERSRPASILWGGLLFSSFVAGFIYLLLLNHTRTLSEKEEKEISDAKDELLALASHQLRTPATGVKQYIGLLRDGYAGKLTTEQKKFLNKAYKSNERQLAIINEMLFVARADSGNIDMQPKDFDVATLIRDILDEQAGVIKERGQKLVSKLPRSKVHLTGDERYIRMAIENILSNATKYTPAKGKITVGLASKKSTVEITITDTGVGVSEENYALLFRKFSRVPNDITAQVSGTGIGMYLAQKIVDAHNGRISFNSAPGKGSECIITLRNKPGSST